MEQATAAEQSRDTVTEASACAEPFLEELDRLVGRHRDELARCVEAWLWAHSGPDILQPGQVRPAACPKTFFEAGLTSEASQERGGSKELVSVVPEHRQQGVPTARRDTWSLRNVAPAHLSRDMQGQDARRRKKKKAKKVAVESLFDSRRLEVQSEMTKFQRVIRSKSYEWLSGTLVFINALFIGFQTEFMAKRGADMAQDGRDPDTTEPAGFIATQCVFCVIFTVELTLRWVCEGLTQFFVGHDMWWNIMDVFVVSTSVLDLGLALILAGEREANSVLGTLSVLRVIRVVRVVRVAKVIRVMKFFRELRMMLFSIVGCAKSLVWVIFCLIMTFYIFGIVFTSAVSSTLDTHAKYKSESTADLRKYFGTLWDSITSLYMAMSGGNDWSVYYDALEQLPGHYRAFFLLFITFAVFAVVNIVTGVFVESAMQSNLQDREIIVHEELEHKKAYLMSMRQVFEEMDKDDTGSITLEEFEKRLDDERVIAYFNFLKLDVSDAHVLFRLLDHDQSNEVSIAEFLSGCYRLQGESRSLDTKIMQVQVRFLQENMAESMILLREMHDRFVPG